VAEKVRAAVKTGADSTEVWEFDLPEEVPEDAALMRVEAAGV
jgi:hypothetical protein